MMVLVVMGGWLAHTTFMMSNSASGSFFMAQPPDRLRQLSTVIFYIRRKQIASPFTKNF
jgi:hypothetical protein